MTAGAGNTSGAGDRSHSDMSEGLYVVGRFLSAKLEQGRPRKEKPGERWPDKFKVTILTGDRTVSVEYADEARARAAVLIGAGMDSSGPDGWPPAMAPVRLPVGTRSAQGYTFFFGRRSGASEEAAA